MKFRSRYFFEFIEVFFLCDTLKKRATCGAFFSNRPILSTLPPFLTRLLDESKDFRFLFFSKRSGPGNRDHSLADEEE